MDFNITPSEIPQFPTIEPTACREIDTVMHNQLHTLLNCPHAEIDCPSRMSSIIKNIEIELQTKSIREIIVPFYRFKTAFRTLNQTIVNVPDSLIREFDALQEKIYLKLEQEESTDDIDYYE